MISKIAQRYLIFGFITFVVLFFFAQSFTNFPILSSPKCEDPSGIDEPFIFVGGFPRSGTTLMRVLLDIHPDIRCGPETRVLPYFTKYGDRILHSKEGEKLAAIGLYPGPMNQAMRLFITTIIRGGGERAPRLCDKDPYVLFGMEYLSKIFPKSQFVYMVRDGRAVANSIVKRHVLIRNIDITNPDEILKKWNSFNDRVRIQCDKIGPKRCLLVKYEDLALQPARMMKKLTGFLKVPLVPEMLNHSASMKDTLLSQFEKSTDQVVHPIHIEAISSWAGATSRLSKEFIQNANTSMLWNFGYLPNSIPPYYGEAEPKQIEITNQLRNNKSFNDVFMT